MKGLKCLASKSWWNAAGTRALKTACQAAIAAVAVNTIWELDLRSIGGVVILAAVVSLLTSLAGIPEVPEK
jgi:hypothetical protein